MKSSSPYILLQFISKPCQKQRVRHLYVKDLPLVGRPKGVSRGAIRPSLGEANKWPAPCGNMGPSCHFSCKMISNPSSVGRPKKVARGMPYPSLGETNGLSAPCGRKGSSRRFIRCEQMFGDQAPYINVQHGHLTLPATERQTKRREAL